MSFGKAKPGRFISRFIPERISNHQAKDTAMVMVLICLLAVIVTDNHNWIYPALVLLVIAMIRAEFFHPFGRIWFGLSTFLSTYVSRIILTIIFIFIICPIGIIRQYLKKDPLLLREWKKSEKSVFKQRNRVYEGKDMSHPY